MSPIINYQTTILYVQQNYILVMGTFVGIKLYMQWVTMINVMTFNNTMLAYFWYLKMWTLMYLCLALVKTFFMCTWPSPQVQHMAIYWPAILKRMGKIQINLLSPSHFGMVFANYRKPILANVWIPNNIFRASKCKVVNFVKIFIFSKTQWKVTI